MTLANTPEDVDKMRALCGPDATIICKIESPSGLTNFEGIVDRADEADSVILGQLA